MMRVFSRFAAAFWLAAIAVLSLLPPQQAVQTDAGDKLEHFAGYALLGLLACVGWRRPWAVLAGCIVYGVAMEVLQGFTGRHPDLYDAVANTLGAITGVAAAFAAERWRPQRVS